VGQNLLSVAPVNARAALADHVLDNTGRLGDASIDIPGLAEAVAPTSTIIGATLIHSAWAGAAEKLVAAGHPPDVWASANAGPAAASPESAYPAEEQSLP
jgi:uncharacterized phosphosugar-binding protein